MGPSRSRVLGLDAAASSIARLLVFVVFVFVVFLGARAPATADARVVARKAELAVLSVASADYVVRFQAAIDSKACYAALQGYSFTLDSRAPDWSPVPNMQSPWMWQKPLALLDQLARYDWILLLDADAAITTSAVRIEELVAEASDILREADGSDPFLVVQDGYDINSGGLLIRGRDVRSEAFVRTWVGWDPAQGFRFYDQDAFMYTLLHHAQESSGRALESRLNWVDLCVPWVTSVHQVAACFSSRMGELGFPLGRRSGFGVAYLFNPTTITRSDRASRVDAAWMRLERRSWFPRPESTSPPPRPRRLRGLNLIVSEGRAQVAAHYHPTQLWRAGDLVGQVTSEDDADQAMEHFLRAVERSMRASGHDDENNASTSRRTRYRVLSSGEEQLRSRPRFPPPTPRAIEVVDAGFAQCPRAHWRVETIEARPGPTAADLWAPNASTFLAPNRFRGYQPHTQTADFADLGRWVRMTLGDSSSRAYFCPHVCAEPAGVFIRWRASTSSTELQLSGLGKVVNVCLRVPHGEHFPSRLFDLVETVGAYIAFPAALEGCDANGGSSVQQAVEETQEPAPLIAARVVRPPTFP